MKYYALHVTIAKSIQNVAMFFGIVLLFSGLIAPSILTNWARADFSFASIPVGDDAVGIAYNSANEDLYITNKADNTVSVIDGATNAIVGSPILVKEVGGIAYNSVNGKIYATDTFANTLAVIDTTTNTIVQHMVIEYSPNGVAYDSANGFIYVVASETNEVYVIATTLSIIAPPDRIVSTDLGKCYATLVNTGIPTISGGVPPLSYDNNHPSEIFPLGTTTVIWTANDLLSHSAHADQLTTVIDNQNPTIAAPPGITVTANTATGASGLSLGSPTINDNCPGFSASSDYPSTSFFFLGTTTVHWTVIDSSGNAASATQIITVNRVAVNVDVKPDTINLKTEKNVTPILFGSPHLDVHNVDIRSLRYGPSLALPIVIKDTQKVLYSDVNDDGITDLVSRYTPSKTRITSSTNNACLVGNLVSSGPAFLGCDVIKTTK
jgi:YVTN family beta-propeller protein